MSCKKPLHIKIHSRLHVTAKLNLFQAMYNRLSRRYTVVYVMLLIAEIPILVACVIFIICGLYTVIPRLTKTIRSGITFVSRNVISPWVSIENRLIRSGCCPLFKDKFYKIVKSTL